MKLLGTPTSPYARKVRIALEEKHIPCEFVVARPSDPNSGVADLNPLGKVPVLVRDDGTALYDSPVIIEYIDGLSGPPKLIPDAFADRIEVKRWEALADGIVDATVAITHNEGMKPEWYLNQQKKIDRALRTMERDLGSKNFCHGTTFSLADIACAFALDYLDRVLSKFEWRTSCPALKALSERLAQRPSIRKTMGITA